uniref:LAGLIDADG endonuclease n=1 Tax=Juglanconis sp. TaxID=2041886 RepID=A0A291LIF8_9PEZI|nr:LAGLIDADG endonuclease [Juglanconis sp.]
MIKATGESLESLIKNPALCPLNPWFVTGFTDGEGSFMIRVRKNAKYRTGFVVEVYFSMDLHKKDLKILQEIQAYFGGVGKIREDVNDKVKFRVESLKDIVKEIIPHFDKYPLITQKLADYLLFRDVVNMMVNKEHLTKEGLNKIVSTKAVINLGLPAELQLYFPDIIPTLRPLVENKAVPHGQWMAGFTSAEGCFKITLVKRPSSSSRGGACLLPRGARLPSGETRRIDQVYLVFQLTQHSRDEKLLGSFITFFGCGILEASSRDPIVRFSVYNFSDNYEKIISFFNRYNIFGVKSIDFQDWCKAAEIIKAKQHLTKEGLNLIVTLKSGINKGRSL